MTGTVLLLPWIQIENPFAIGDAEVVNGFEASFV